MAVEVEGLKLSEAEGVGLSEVEGLGLSEVEGLGLSDASPWPCDFFLELLDVKCFSGISSVTDWILPFRGSNL